MRTPKYSIFVMFVTAAALEGTTFAADSAPPAGNNGSPAIDLDLIEVPFP